MSLRDIPVSSLCLNPMEMIAKDWWLVTAGNEDRGYNTMTASWGHLGSLWRGEGHPGGRPTAVIFVRPQRYTKEFLDREAHFTLSVLPESYRKALGYLGTHSGREGDKVKTAGLTPVFDGESTWFAEARLVLVCKKLYQAPLVERGFIDPALVEENYPQRDFHEVYIGEIVRALAEEGPGETA